MNKIPKSNNKAKVTEYSSTAPWRIYNISSSNPSKLKEYICEIEKNLKKKFKFKNLPLQKGDVKKNKWFNEFNYKKISL